ncbi:hypothetical protein BaRGS_00040062, partial [Batillaria attramentaria]
HLPSTHPSGTSTLNWRHIQTRTHTDVYTWAAKRGSLVTPYYTKGNVTHECTQSPRPLLEEI